MRVERYAIKPQSSGSVVHFFRPNHARLFLLNGLFLLLLNVRHLLVLHQHREQTSAQQKNNDEPYDVPVHNHASGGGPIVLVAK